MITPACSFSRSFWSFRERGVFSLGMTVYLLLLSSVLLLYPSCGDSVHLVFRSLLEGIIPHVVVDLLYPWEDRSSRSPHVAILNLPSPLCFFLHFSNFFFFLIHCFLLLCYLLISSNVGFGKHFGIYVIYYWIQQVFFEFLLSSKNTGRLIGGGLLENLARGHSLYFKHLRFL